MEPHDYSAGSAAAYKLIIASESRLPFFVKDLIVHHDAEVKQFCDALSKAVLDSQVPHG